MRMKLLFTVTLVLFALFAFAQIWETTSLSNKYAHRGAASHNSQVFFAGGGFNGSNYSEIDIYDVEKKTWDLSNELSVARMLPAGISCGNKIIFAGGFEDFSFANVNAEVDIYNYDTRTWTLEQMSVPRLVSAISYGDLVMLAGGIEQLGVISNVIDYFNSSTGEWSSDTLPESREISSAIVAGDFAFFSGGIVNPSKRVDIYNFITKEWTFDSLSVARINLVSASVGNKVLFAGGMTSDEKPSKIVDIYDIETGEWSVGELSVPRAFGIYSKAPTIDEKVYFVGGGKIQNGGWSDSEKIIDIYDNFTGEWSEIELPKSLVNHTVISTLNKLLVAGGVGIYSSGIVIPNQSVYIYTDSTVRVEEIALQDIVTFYPNPADDYLIFESIKESISIDKISIYDQMGSIVFKKSSISDRIDISALQSGIYIIELIVNGNIYFERLVVR